MMVSVNTCFNTVFDHQCFNFLPFILLYFIFYRAADWKLDQPDWTGRVRVCAKGKECYIKIEDKTSGEFYNTPTFSHYHCLTLICVVFVLTL